jgi:hypothetical protein
MTQPQAILGRSRRGPDWKRIGAFLAMFSTLLLVNYRKQAPIARTTLSEHGYSIVGLGLLAGAAWYHSPFAGLLVTGIMFLLFEWKVSELCHLPYLTHVGTGCAMP